MNTARRALVVLYLFSMFAVAGDGLANGAEVRHYLVELTEASTASVDITDVAKEVARTYGGRLESYAAGGFHGFALTMTPERARLLSADPRAKTVRESNALHPATEVVPIGPVTLGPYVYDADAPQVKNRNVCES